MSDGKWILKYLPLAALGSLVVVLLKQSYNVITELEREFARRAEEEEKEAAATMGLDSAMAYEQELLPSFSPNFLEVRHTIAECSFDGEEDVPVEIAEKIAEALRDILKEEHGEDIDVEFNEDVSLEEADAALGPDGDRIVFAITPNGEVISSYFSEDNMRMAKEVAAVEDKSLDEVLLETMAERYELKHGNSGDEL